VSGTTLWVVGVDASGVERVRERVGKWIELEQKAIDELFA